MLTTRVFVTVLLISIFSTISPPGVAATGDDTIKLTFLGTGAPRPSHTRYGPSILLEAGEHRILVDAGPGMRERLFQAGGFELLTDIDHVLLTHLHFDHTISVPGLWLTGWLYGRKTPMTVYGPTGTAAMMKHFRAAYDWDIRYREIVGVHKEGSDLIAHDVSPGVVFDKDGLKVTAFNVEHMPINVETGELLGLEGATIGYRIDYKGRSVLFSGDTRSTPSTRIIEHGKGVDVLIHEVQVPAPGDTPEARLANVSLSVHSTPAQVAYVFEKTRPRMGVYSHIIPPEISSDELLGATDYDGEMMVAEDLMTLTIGDEITVGRAERAGTDIFTEADVVDK
ncbi:MAG: MBL fold metallo-hydrolase [Gammaproteobacteria bacterium]|nr:MBL fold metallo-hydrolase [Gammaproteobacteria bacterium]